MNHSPHPALAVDVFYRTEGAASDSNSSSTASPCRQAVLFVVVEERPTARRRTLACLRPQVGCFSSGREGGRAGLRRQAAAAAAAAAAALAATARQALLPSPPSPAPRTAAVLFFAPSSSCLSASPGRQSTRRRPASSRAAGRDDDTTASQPVLLLRGQHLSLTDKHLGEEGREGGGEREKSRERERERDIQNPTASLLKSLWGLVLANRRCNPAQGFTTPRPLNQSSTDELVRHSSRCFILIRERGLPCLATSI